MTENAPSETPTGLTPEAIGAMVGTVKLPEFWSDNTALWFARADAQFRLKKITAEQTKFDYHAGQQNGCSGHGRPGQST